MTRALLIDPAAYPKLQGVGPCFHIGEYTVGGTYRFGETNSEISNLKKKPPVEARLLQYKERAIRYWGGKLAEVINLPLASQNITLVPMPCSKTAGNPQFDDRMRLVLEQLRLVQPNLDIRPLLRTVLDRPPQHETGRMTIAELAETMAVDPAYLVTPLKPTVLIVDDVLTTGGTFAAAHGHIRGLPNVAAINGLFLAKAIWPIPDPALIFGMVPIG
jgi:predicted amidophosphoribosyltransferase